MKRSFAFGLIVLFMTTPIWAMSINESVEIALKNNPLVIAAEKRLNAAGARKGQAIGAFLPTLKIDGTVGRSYTQPSIVQIEVPPVLGGGTQTFIMGSNDPSNNQSLFATVSQPIFVGALFPGYQIANKSYDSSYEELRKTIADTTFSVIQSYFGVLRAEKFVKLSEESKEMSQSHYDQIKAMLAAGTATKADKLRTEVQLANSELNLTRARNALEIAKDAFNNALGRNLEEPVELTSEEYNISVNDLPEYSQLLADAFENRPEWRQFVLGRQIGEENVSIARTEYLPTLKASWRFGDQIVEYPTYRSDVNSWAVTGTASWTLFDGLGIQNRIKEAQANLEALKANEESVRKGIKLEVRDAYLNYKSALEAISFSQKAQASAEENNKVSQLRYTSGVGTNLEVIDSQVALTQARINYSQSIFDLQIAKAKLNLVIGKEVL